MADPRRGRLRSTCTALVGRRLDFRESSRLVTLFTREHGRITVLAKGAHRPDSPFVGRIDLFNELLVTLGPDRGGLRLLERAELRAERRALRVPARFLAACCSAGLCEAALPPERPDAEVYDLLAGGLLLLERCPTAAIPQIVLGLELRMLRHLGALPDLRRCAACGDDLLHGGFRGADGSLTCRRHAPSPRVAVRAETLQWLEQLEGLPGRRWPELDPTQLPTAAVALCGSWLATALEWRSRLRPAVFRAPPTPPTAVEVDKPA